MTPEWTYELEKVLGPSRPRVTRRRRPREPRADGQDFGFDRLMAMYRAAITPPPERAAGPGSDETTLAEQESDG